MNIIFKNNTTIRNVLVSIKLLSTTLLAVLNDKIAP
jgi:hypothetical protein